MSGLEPAAEADLPIIRDCIARFRLDGERVERDQFLVLREEGKLAAFGRIKPYQSGVFELGSVGVMEDRRGAGLGKRMVSEFIRRFPSKEIYITTDLPGYFEPFGFRKIDEMPPAIRTKLTSVCDSLRCGSVAMLLVKP